MNPETIFEAFLPFCLCQTAHTPIKTKTIKIIIIKKNNRSVEEKMRVSAKIGVKQGRKKKADIGGN